MSNLANANNASPTYVQPWSFLPSGFSNIQLDIVGFLAILGEASVLNNGQVASLSWTSCIPRLIPAPQALIRTQRPERLQTSTGIVIGPHSGNIRRHVNHITHIIHQAAFYEHKIQDPESRPYSVAAITIDWADGLPDSQKDVKDAVKKGADKSRVGRHAAVATFRPWGWQALLTYLGFAMSVGLFVGSIVIGDGMSLLAVVCLSVLSTLVGLVNLYTLELPERMERRENLPSSDVIISYPNGSFLVVNCPEAISRLYTHTEQCAYFIKPQWAYRFICLVATMLLMIGVICLANATEWLQVAWAACYIILNAAYWAVAALPARVHWDLSSFKTNRVEFEWYMYRRESKEKNAPWKAPQLKPGSAVDAQSTFTESLWKAIGVTQGSKWARTAEIAPNTPDWDGWLREAERQSLGVIETPLAQQPPKRSWTGLSRKTSRSTAYGRQQSIVQESKDLESGAQQAPQEPKQGTTQANSQNKKTLPEWNYSAKLTEYLRQGNHLKWDELKRHESVTMGDPTHRIRSLPSN